MESRRIGISSLWLACLALGCSATSGAPAVKAVAPALGGQAPTETAASLEKSVVAVLAEGQNYDFTSPWAKHRPWSTRTTGLVVEGNHILVAGSRLANQTLIEVQKFGLPKRYPARVLIADYEAALILLEVTDKKFFDGLAPLPLAPEVPTQGQVDIARWLGSGKFETAHGYLRQITVGEHDSGRAMLLSLDVSASLEGGGASEVIVSGGAAIGLATSKTDNQLKAIAAPALRQFVKLARKPPYLGFARGGFTTEWLTNPALRAYLKVPDDAGGVLIRSLQGHGSVASVLKPGDVVLEVGGHAIDESGRFNHPRYGRLPLAVLFTLDRSPGDKLPARILRGGQTLEVLIPLRRMLPEEDVAPPYVFDRPPEHLVVGGLVLQYLTRSFLETYGDWTRSAPLHLLVAYDQLGAFPTPERKRIVIISRVLPDPVNVGYQNLDPVIVEEVNGRRAGTLADVKKALATPAGGFHIFKLAPGQGTSRIVLDAQETATAESRVRKLYNLPGKAGGGADVVGTLPARE